VLPFRILNKEAENISFLSLGFPDAIITRLANVRQIRLRPTSAILRYENQNVDAQEAGPALSSDYVVMGTVQKVEERLRVSVQLLRASDGALIWGKPYDEPRASLLDLQDSIAGSIGRERSRKADGHWNSIPISTCLTLFAHAPFTIWGYWKRLIGIYAKD